MSPTQLLGCSLEHKLHPAAEYLREVGVVDVGRFVQTFPASLCYRRARRSLQACCAARTLVRIACLASLLTPRARMRSLKRKLGRTVSWLRAAGVHDVGALLTALPALAGYSVPANLEPKRRLLVDVMGRPIEDAERFPAYWAYSLQGRILPRYAYLLEHGAQDKVSLSSMLSATDANFAALPALRRAAAAGVPATAEAYQAHVATPAFAARLAALERSGRLWSDAAVGASRRQSTAVP